MSIVEPIAAFTPQARILFQGDSITDGNRGRSEDPNHVLGHGYVFIIAARHGAAFPQAQVDFINRGISGNTVVDLERRWQSDALAVRPDLLSVLIGVNDALCATPVEVFERVYATLIDQARAANPKLTLVLGEPFRGRADDATRRLQEAVARLSRRCGAIHVPFQRVFDDAATRAPIESWIWDDIHPTYRGHQLMADAWESAVRAGC